MSHPDSPSALLAPSAALPVQRAMQTAYLWILAILAGAAGLTGLVYLESSRNGHEAGRMIVAAQSNNGYVTGLVHGLTQRHGHPAR